MVTINSKTNGAIGVFDSGVGGFTVAKEIFANLPLENIIYYGDTKRVPYGNFSEETIEKYTLQICDFLMSFGVKALVAACNTISVTCLDVVKKRYDVPVIGVIEPGATAALATAKNAIGIFATYNTINSKAYETHILSVNSKLKIYSKSCPLFVPIVEEGFADTPIAYHTALEYLKEFDGKDIDTLILGCTHYPIMKNEIQKAAGPSINIVDPSYGTAIKLKEELEVRGLLLDPSNTTREPNKHKFFLSGEKNRFDLIAKSVFNKDFASQVHSFD